MVSALPVSVYTTLFEWAPRALLMVDADLVVEEANIRAQSHLGRSAAELVGRRIPDLFPGLPELDPDIPPGQARSLRWEPKGYTDMELRFSLLPCPDGMRYLVSLDGPSEEAMEESRRRLALAREELEAKERALRESQALRDAFMEHAPVAVAIRDAEGRYLFLNGLARAVLEAHGVVPDQALGRHPGDLLARTVLGPALDRSALALQVDTPVVGEVTAPFPDGERVFQSLHFALRDGEGRPFALVAMGTDITAHKRAEEALQALAEHLQRRNRDLEDFAAAASHDLHEPLRKITTFADYLASRCRDQLDGVGQDRLERIQLSASRMRSFIDDLLRYSRLELEEPELGLVDLGAVLDEAAAEFEGRMEELGAELRVEGPLPVVRGDQAQFRQLFLNLLGNSLKYHREGVPPRIRLRASLEGGRHRIAFEDNGIGFEPQYAERIFGVFQRLHSRSSYEGSGVGLAICRRILERHGGTLRAEGRPGEGATFHIELPG